MTRTRAARAAGFLLLTARLLGAHEAHANGAFPDTQALWWDDAGLVLATNFGVLHSDADVRRWTWTCELGLAANGALYAESGSGRLFTLGSEGLAYSDDRACTWRAPASPPAPKDASDYFVDPTQPLRIWLIAGASGQEALYVSQDGGTSFTQVAAAPEPGDTLVGVENAVSEPERVALLAQAPSPAPPLLGVSRDGGGSFVWKALAGLAGSTRVRLAAIDRREPSRLYLRVARAEGGEALAVVTGADGTSEGRLAVETPVQAAGKMTAFVQRAAGSLVVAGNDPTGPWAFQSQDGGATFQAWATGGIHVKALTEKDGTLYVAADQLGAGDPFVVASRDETTQGWQPLLSSFRNTASVASCAASACRATCETYVEFGLFPGRLCRTDGETDGGTSDGGRPTTDGGIHDASSPEDADGALDDGGVQAPARGDHGCACAVTAPASSSAGTSALALAAATIVSLKRRRRVSAPRAGRR